MGTFLHLILICRAIFLPLQPQIEQNGYRIIGRLDCQRSGLLCALGGFAQGD